MHEKSLPAGDRSDQAGGGELADRRTAFVIQLADGSYFKALRSRGQGVSVRSLSRARLFFSQANEVLKRTIAKLRRKGIAAAAVEVRLIVPAIDCRRPGSSKPPWRITADGILAFEAARGRKGPAPKPARRRAKAESGVIEFF